MNCFKCGKPIEQPAASLLVDRIAYFFCSQKHLDETTYQTALNMLERRWENEIRKDIEYFEGVSRVYGP